MNNSKQGYLKCVKPVYLKQQKGYTLHSRASKQFGMASSVPTIYYGGLTNRVDGHKTISMSQGPILIKSKVALNESIHFLQSSGLLPLYSYLTVREVNYRKVYLPSSDRHGRPKDVLGDQITSVISEESLEKDIPTFNLL